MLVGAGAGLGVGRLVERGVGRGFVLARGKNMYIYIFWGGGIGKVAWEKYMSRNCTE